jgi:citrate synthase
MRQLTSTGIDPFTALSGAASALYGPSHGGANEAALKMLEEIGTVDAIPEFIADVKAKKRRLMGFGHRIYKSYDPRAKILKKIADQVFEIMGRNQLIDVAIELERIALSDGIFSCVNVFYRILYQAQSLSKCGFLFWFDLQSHGFSDRFFPGIVLPRSNCGNVTVKVTQQGWLAHWREQLNDPIPIFRPQQYSEMNARTYMSMEDRTASKEEIDSMHVLLEKQATRRNLRTVNK